MLYTKKIVITALAALALSSAGALSAFADEAATASGSATTTLTVTVPSKSAVFASLVPLVTAREDAIAAAWAKQSAAFTAAIQARKTALVAAFGLTDKKSVRKAVETAYKNYSDALKSARKTSLVERKAAWDAYRAGVKALKDSAAASIEASNSSSADLSTQ